MVLPQEPKKVPSWHLGTGSVMKPMTSAVQLNPRPQAAARVGPAGGTVLYAVTCTRAGLSSPHLHLSHQGHNQQASASARDLEDQPLQRYLQCG